MNVDKSNGNVKYNDENHLYWDDNGKYVSVTTLIHSFSQPFDEDFWSKYKALEKLLTKEQFKLEKKNLMTTKKVDLNYFLDMYNFSLNDFNREQQNILDEWQKKNLEACERGTKIHADLEHSLTKKKVTDLKKYGFGGKFSVNTNDSLNKSNTDLLSIDRGVFPEYLIYRCSDDGKFRLAGQIDLLIKDGNDIYLRDFKGLSLDTKIPTINGWSTIGEIKEGDIIFDKNGNPTKIIHKSSIHLNPCFKIVFDNGDSIIADHEHRWEISFKTNGKPKNHYTSTIMTTEEIYKYLEIIKDKRNTYNIPKILNPKPLNLPDIKLPIDPYVLGAWLGDGSKSCGIITQAKNSPLWNEIKKRGYEIGKNAQHNPDRENVEMRTVYGLKTLLNSLGLKNKKFIPDIYQRASYSQRLDLLRGLMDTDGYYHPKRKRFVMATGQEWQRDDMVKLLSSLGVKTTVFEVKRKCEGKKFTAWDVCFSTDEFNPFLIRNQDIVIDTKNKRTFRNIIAVEKVDTVPTQCLEVDSPTHTFLCTEKMIVTHNTNSKIDEKSFYNSSTKKYQMLQYPLNNLMDCNKVHYTLQLSTYAWMIQQLNPEFVIKRLTIDHFDHNGGYTEYDVDYLKDDVVRMCKWYKKQILLKEMADKRKKIEF